MLLPYLNTSLFPEDVIAGSAPLTPDSILDALNEPDTKPDEQPIELEEPKKEAKKVAVEEKVDEEEKIDEEIPEDEDIDELAELEKELQEPDPEKLELQTPVRRREILKKYPNLFKDFPYLETAYYRDLKFTEIVPTIDDAKEAVAKAQTLDNFETALSNGDTETVLKAVHQENPEAFAKIADNYLETLAKVDIRAYHHVLANTMKHTITAMVAEGKESGNESLVGAAALLNQFIFGTSKFTPPSKLAVEKSDKPEDKISEREREFNKQRFTRTRDEISTTVSNRLKATIAKNLDPKESMTPYVRTSATRDALEKVNELISQDTRFRTLLDKLWQGAIKSDFSEESVDRIRSAYFTKAKTLLPAVIKRARNEALKGMGKRVKEEETDETTETNDSIKSPARRESTPQNNGGKIRSPKDIPAGMSTLDVLMKD